MKKLLSLLLVCAAGLLPASAITLGPTTDGINVTGPGSQMSFKLAFPILITSDGKEIKSKSADIKDTAAVVNYEGGGTATLTVDPSGSLHLSTANLPPTVKRVKMTMLLNFDLRNGGTFQAANKPAVPFPADLPKNPHIFQGNPDSLTLRDSDGQGITITTPQYSYQELTDNRAWNWKIFAWMSLADLPASGELDYRFVDAAPATPPASPSAPANP